MKVFCDACGTKYSIDDSRVAGKAFKIRCKKCDHVIIKRAPTAPVTEPVPDAGVWHAVIDGSHRPIALADLHRMRAAGELDDGALVWREGFDDWRALGTVEELRAVAGSVEVSPDAAAAQVPAYPVLRNERGEDSVLFSLSKLAKIAARPPAPTAAAPATGTEGSGLLDIRSIARKLAPGAARAHTERGSLDDLPVYGPVTFGEPAVLVPRRPRGGDRRLVWALAASVGMLAAVTALLVVVVVRNARSAHAEALPTARPAPAGPAIRPAATAANASAGPAATAIAPAAPAAAPAASTAAAPTAAAPGASTAAAPGAPTAAASPAEPAIATRSAAQPVAADAAAAASAGPPLRTAAAGARRAPAHASPEQPAAPATAPALQPAAAGESCSEVTCIVNSYADRCCEIYRTRADSRVAPPPGPPLPDSLDRATIVAGLSRIDTSGCRAGSAAHGDVTASIKVSADGAVTSVTVKSSPDPALSACVTAAARNGSFAPTQRGGSFAYVWRF
jgi:predicted Zn finger-like uncharacterized protein